jgi:peptidoglycan/LPS O-acetylase OafA/YrhL
MRAPQSAVFDLRAGDCSARSLRIALAAILVVLFYRTGWYAFMNWGHLWFPSEASYFRIHYATDTRVDAILIGCALALLMREGRLQGFWRRCVSPAV